MKQKTSAYIKCSKCGKAAHGQYTTENSILLRCLNCAPSMKVAIAFKPLNMHLKGK